MVATTVREALKAASKNGYNAFPVISKSKLPAIKSWQDLDITDELVDSWAKSMPTCGVGLRGDVSPCLDLDVLDGEFVAELLDYIDEFVVSKDQWMQRTGLAPKTALIFRADFHVGRRNSEWFVPDTSLEERRANKNFKYQLETRGELQYFVAFGIHDVTKKPFTWDSGRSPANTHVDDVMSFTEEQLADIFAEFDRMCEARGLEQGSSSSGAPARVSTADPDDEDYDAFAHMEAPRAGVSIGELRQVCLQIDLTSEDVWTKVAMAINHESDGSEDGYELLDELSCEYSGYDEHNNRKRWDSFSSERRSVGATSTYGTLVHLAQKASLARVTRMVSAIERQEDIQGLKKVTNKIARRQLDALARSQVMTALEDKLKELGVKLKKTQIAEMIEYHQDVSGTTVWPDWCTNHIFSEEANAFINRKTMLDVKAEVFDRLYARYLLTDDDISKRRFAIRASDYASNVAKIDSVRGVRYAPYAQTGVFTDCHVRYYNSFDPSTLAIMPDEYSEIEKMDLDTVRDYFFVMFPDARERQYVVEWLAHVAVNPEQRANYSLVIQGAQGSGKSVIGDMMKAVLGEVNVGVVSNASIKSEFSGWSAGHVLKVVEEVSVSGHRFDIMNNLKEKITNDFIEIIRKGKDGTPIRNTAAYLMLTNDVGALAIDPNDRRYLVVSQQFQCKADVDDFKAENPDFYLDFKMSFIRSPGAIRKWLSTQLGREGFNPTGGVAPADTSARSLMVEVSRDEFALAFEEILADPAGLCFVSEDLFFMPNLRDAIAAEVDERFMPRTKAMARRLSELGFRRVGSPKLTGSQCQCRPVSDDRTIKGVFYARRPRLFQKEDGFPCIKTIRAAFENDDSPQDF